MSLRLASPVACYTFEITSCNKSSLISLSRSIYHINLRLLDILMWELFFCFIKYYLKREPALLFSWSCTPPKGSSLYTDWKAIPYVRLSLFILQYNQRSCCNIPKILCSLAHAHWEFCKTRFCLLPILLYSSLITFLCVRLNFKCVFQPGLQS